MGHSREAGTQHLAERWGWQAARRDEARVARRLYRNEVVDGVYRLDEGARLDAFFPCLRELGGLEWLAGVQGTAWPREMVPGVQDLRRSGVKTLGGMERMKALPGLRCRAAALLPWVGLHAPQVRHGVCQRGAATRQRPRPEGPMGSATVAHHRVPRHLRDLEAWFNGTMQALAKAGIFGAQVMGMVDATALETTAAYAGCGPGTRRRQSTDQQGHVRALEVTVYGGKPLVVIAALTTMPLAVQVVPIHEPAGRSRRALGTPARTHLAGCARLHTVVCARGVWAGAERWWLDRHGLTGVVPAHANMAVTVEARAPAAVGEGLTMGRRVQTVRHGPGQTAWTARRETEVGGITGLTTDAPSGTPEHRRHHTRRGGAPNPIPAVVVRPGNGHEDGPGGQPGFLTHAAVPQPLKPCEDADDRRRLEHGCIKAATPPWDLGHAPQKTGRAVRGQVVFPCLRLARATAYRLPCEPAEVRAEPVGWQRGRRQLLAQTRDKVIVFTEGW